MNKPLYNDIVLTKFWFNQAFLCIICCLS